VHSCILSLFKEGTGQITIANDPRTRQKLMLLNDQFVCITLILNYLMAMEEDAGGIDAHPDCGLSNCLAPS
jgi:hypothetical protein